MRDHPRGCGEKGTLAKKKVEIEGSSPRVRGEEADELCKIAGHGIIPAGAGRSGHLETVVEGGGDHPRGCGEKTGVSLTIDSGKGSSPRVRGEGRGLRRARARSGIIPAGAGRSKKLRRPPPNPQDHPRGCGEKFEDVHGIVSFRGSSPRVRGEVTFGYRGDNFWGIIPAGAGRRPRPSGSRG